MDPRPGNAPTQKLPLAGLLPGRNDSADPRDRAPSPSLMGLTTEEARAALSKFGPNEISLAPGTPAWRMLLRQFASPLVWLLMGACVVSVALGDVVDAIAIGVIIVINGGVGFFQEYRAETAMAALRSLTAPRAQVLRDGRRALVSAAEVVPGDVLLLDAGDIVAADAQLLEAHTLATNEAPLTGESAPVDKQVDPTEPTGPASTGPAAPLPDPADVADLQGRSASPKVSLSEQHGRVFMGTAVSRGTGAARVFATGMATELGRIAHLLATAEETETPLQTQLGRVSRVLLFLCLAIVALTAGIGLLRGTPPLEVLMAAVSLAVAAVPEGLPAIVTIALAIGVQRMAARNVLVRRLPSVETLGSATVICTDKTGTLTTGVMVVRELWGADHDELLRAAAACCDADLDATQRSGSGDPTEVALLVAAAERGISRAEIESANPRRDENPFDADRKRMSIYRADGVLYVKGAVESILPLCEAEGAATPGGANAPAGEHAPTTSPAWDGARVLEANAQMASRGLRVLAVAVGSQIQERELRLLGLAGIADPPRPEAIEALAAAHAASIRTVMITGDHPITAGAIARELGLVRPGEDPGELVYARATPEDKLMIVRRWKQQGSVVAMTGDGVNDAPALREAHIGIAMGITGTEVTREASDVVLTDDNFASIIAAVREGRGIFENIRKTVVYLLTGNAAELLLMLAASLMGLPLPLLPLHLLWTNLVTDGFPALALVMDPTEGDLMKRPPRPPAEPMLGGREWRNILLLGALEAALVIGVFHWALAARTLEQARYLAFSTLVFSELFRSFAARSRRRLLWEVGPLSNVRLVAVVILSALFQLAIPHLPFTANLFQISGVHVGDTAITLLCALVPVSTMELGKLVLRSTRARSRPGGPTSTP